jgi:hypothetical protein
VVVQIVGMVVQIVGMVVQIVGMVVQIVGMVVQIVGMVVSELWSNAGVAVPRGKRPGWTGMANRCLDWGICGSPGIRM